MLPDRGRTPLAAGLLLSALLGACKETPPRAPAAPIAQAEDLAELAGQLGAAGTATERFGPAEATVAVPYGERLEYHLSLAPGTVLRAERIVSSPGAPGRLQILLATDDSTEREVATLDESTEAVEVALTAGERLAARLSFVAVAGSSASSDGVIGLSAPALWAPDATADRTGAPQRSDSPENELSAEATTAAPTPGRPRFPDIVLYLVDTLRPDHLGAYGYSRPTSPHFDAFAASAHRFEYAVGQSPWTRPSVASIFSGMTPHAHGVKTARDRLSAALPHLPALLQRAGYATTAVFSNPNVSAKFGFARGFDEVIKARFSDNDPTRKAIQWLRSHSADRPFFLYAHTSEPHQPYLPSMPYRQRFAPGAESIAAAFEKTPQRYDWEPEPETVRALEGLYDGEIAENDAGFGELITALRDLGLYDSSIIVYVSDHGEEFYEGKRWGHGKSMLVEQLNVALAIKLPGQTLGTTVAEAVQHADLLPTLADVLDLAAPLSIEGRSLVPLMTDLPGQASAEPAPIFSHNHRGRLHSVVFGDFKLVQRTRRGGARNSKLYNWRKDPLEQHELSSERPILAKVLSTMIERQRHRHRRVAGEKAEIDEATEKELRALGYLE